MQESILFNDSVHNNIIYGCQDTNQQQIIQTAKDAYAYDFIDSLTDGFNTSIGELSGRLSGRQKQRICIARALLKNAPILILDEATSSLDSESETLVQKALGNLMQGRTTFIIAHRIQSVMGADLILVLNRGRIEQAGTHDELVHQEGMYQRIYRAQTRIEDELQKELSRDSAP